MTANPMHVTRRLRERYGKCTVPARYLRDRAGLSKSALALDIAAWCRSAEILSDGFVDELYLPYLLRLLHIRERRVAELVDARLWTRVDGGWQLTGFSAVNPSSQTVEQRRAAERLRRARASARNDA